MKPILDELVPMFPIQYIVHFNHEISIWYVVCVTSHSTHQVCVCSNHVVLVQVHWLHQIEQLIINLLTLFLVSLHKKVISPLKTLINVMLHLLTQDNLLVSNYKETWHSFHLYAFTLFSNACG